MNKLLLIALLVAPYCGCDRKEPEQKPDGGHSVLVLPPDVEARIAAIEAAIKPSPSLLELQEHVAKIESQIDELKKHECHCHK